MRNLVLSGCAFGFVIRVHLNLFLTFDLNTRHLLFLSVYYSLPVFLGQNAENVILNLSKISEENNAK